MVATWDSDNKSAGTTLSNGDLTATVTSGTSQVACKRTVSGPTYFEVTIGASLTGSTAVGIVNRAYNMAGGTLLGTDARGCGYRNSGAVIINNATITTIASYVATNTICVAVDWAKSLIWFRVNNGDWNNDVIGNQNPEGAVGGISLATMEQGSCKPAFGSTTVTPNQSGTAVFAAGTFAYSVPTGYSSVDVLQSSGSNLTNSKASAGLDISTFAKVNSFPTGVNGWYGNVRVWSPANTITAVSGIVQENGVNISGKIVRLYDRNSGDLIGTTISAGDGSFSIPALGRTSTYVVSLDAPFNAIIFDSVTPV